MSPIFGCMGLCNDRSVTTQPTPFTVPVIAEGTQNLKLQLALLNGNSEDRIPYPFTKFIEQTHTFEGTHIDTLRSVFELHINQDYQY